MSPALRRMIERLNVPALVMTVRWDVVAWNRLVCKCCATTIASPPAAATCYASCSSKTGLRSGPGDLRGHGAPGRRQIPRRLQHLYGRSAVRGSHRGSQHPLGGVSAAVEQLGGGGAVGGDRPSSAARRDHAGAHFLRAGRQPGAPSRHLHAVRRGERGEDRRARRRRRRAVERLPADTLAIRDRAAPARRLLPQLSARVRARLAARLRRLHAAGTETETRNGRRRTRV